MKIWSRTKLKYTKVKARSSCLTSEYNGEPVAFPCARCGAELTMGVDVGYISHLYVPNDSDHDKTPAYIVCKECIEKECAEERELLEKYGTYNLPNPIED